jgi:hypothetical protein
MDRPGRPASRAGRTTGQRGAQPGVTRRGSYRVARRKRLRTGRSARRQENCRRPAWDPSPTGRNRQGWMGSVDPASRGDAGRRHGVCRWTSRSRRRDAAVFFVPSVRQGCRVGSCFGRAMCWRVGSTCARPFGANRHRGEARGRSGSVPPTPSADRRSLCSGADRRGGRTGADRSDRERGRSVADRPCRGPPRARRARARHPPGPLTPRAPAPAAGTSGPCRWRSSAVR